MLKLRRSRLMLQQGMKRCRRELLPEPYFELEPQQLVLQLQLLDRLRGPLLLRWQLQREQLLVMVLRELRAELVQQRPLAVVMAQP